MPKATETIVVSGTKDVIDAIRAAMDAQPGSQTSVTSRRNLDGNTAAWIVVASLAVQALPTVLAFVKDSLASKKVKKIKVGDVEIENPTPEQVESLLKEHRSKAAT